jgi:hypothetical protein
LLVGDDDGECAGDDDEPHAPINKRQIVLFMRQRECNDLASHDT